MVDYITVDYPDLKLVRRLLNNSFLTDCLAAMTSICQPTYKVAWIKKDYLERTPSTHLCLRIIKLQKTLRRVERCFIAFNFFILIASLNVSNVRDKKYYYGLLTDRSGSWNMYIRYCFSSNKIYEVSLSIKYHAKSNSCGSLALHFIENSPLILHDSVVRFPNPPITINWLSAWITRCAFRALFSSPNFVQLFLIGSKRAISFLESGKKFPLLFGFNKSHD